MIDGDYIMCKKDYFWYSKKSKKILIFEKYHTYKFNYMFTSYLLSNIGSLKVYNVDHINLTENDFIEHFYTMQEARKIKLEILNNAQQNSLNLHN